MRQYVTRQAKEIGRSGLQGKARTNGKITLQEDTIREFKESLRGEVEGQPPKTLGKQLRRRIPPARKEIAPISFQLHIAMVLFNYFICLKKDVLGDVQADRPRGF